MQSSKCPVVSHWYGKPLDATDGISFFILDTAEISKEASAASRRRCLDQGFGVLAVHDLGNTCAQRPAVPEQVPHLRVWQPQQAPRCSQHQMARSHGCCCQDLRLSTTEAGQNPHRHDRPEGVCFASLSADPLLREGG